MNDLTELDAAAITAIEQVVVRERESRDLCLWNRMLDCFHPDSEVRISWFQGSGPDFVTASREMVKKGTLAKHRLGPVLVTLNGAKAVASLSAVIDVPIRVRGVDFILSAHCLLLYRVERRGGVWRIAGFDVIYRRDEINPLIPDQTMSISPEALTPFRPSYRLLSYVLELEGFKVSADLPGEDRPETARAVMEKVFHWAGLEVPS